MARATASGRLRSTRLVGSLMTAQKKSQPGPDSPRPKSCPHHAPVSPEETGDYSGMGFISTIPAFGRLRQKNHEF